MAKKKALKWLVYKILFISISQGEAVVRQVFSKGRANMRVLGTMKPDSHRPIRFHCIKQRKMSDASQHNQISAQ
jgi:hypothetical protein